MPLLASLDGAPSPIVYGYGRSKVANCSVHLAVATEAESRLSFHGSFAMPDVIRALGFQAIAKAIRWPSLITLIEDRYQCGLVPVTRAYFNRQERFVSVQDADGKKTRHDRAVINPEKFLAGGPNKPTYGYVLTGGEDPGRRAIVMESFRRLVAQKGGTDNAVQARRKLLEQTGCLENSASDDLLTAECAF